MSYWFNGLRVGQLSLLTLGMAIALSHQTALSYQAPLSNADPDPSDPGLLAHRALPALPPNPALFVPKFPSFNSQPLDLQVRLYSRYLMANGAPDVLIVGSSRALQGVDPVALQQSLAAIGYPNLRIYNFSINGATARVVELILQQILPPDQLPRILIWADGSRAFNSAKLDVTYNGITASAGYAQLGRGQRPIELSLEVLPAPSPEICIDLPTVPTAQALSFTQALSFKRAQSQGNLAQFNLTQIKPANSIPSLPSRKTSSDLFLDHQPSLLSAFTPACSLFPNPNPLIPTRLPQRDSSSVIEQSSASPINSNGFQFISTQFDPSTYYRRFPRVAGQYDDNYVPFRFAGEQTSATVAIARFAQRHHIQLLFVNLPLTQEYLDPVRQRYEQQFRQHMQQLATQQTFLFQDLSQRWSTQNQYFADPSHLNGEGARAVSVYLANDAGIPWDRLLR